MGVNQSYDDIANSIQNEMRDPLDMFLDTLKNNTGDDLDAALAELPPEAKEAGAQFFAEKKQAFMTMTNTKPTEQKQQRDPNARPLMDDQNMEDVMWDESSNARRGR